MLDLIACLPLYVNAPDYGGWIVRDGYLGRAHRSLGCPVVIDSLCASACTLYLNNPRACVTPRAVLHFHSLATSQAMLSWHRARYSTRVRARIDTVLGQAAWTPQGVELRWPQTTWFAPACGRGQ